MDLAIFGGGRVPTLENTPGWYFEPGGPYYVPKPDLATGVATALYNISQQAHLTRPTVNLRLSKFNMTMVPDDAVVLMLGGRGTGKSSLIKDLLWYKQRFPVGAAISEKEDTDAFYSSFIPSLFVHDEFNPAIISNVLKRQDAMTKQIRKETETCGESEIDRRAFIVMDDCMYDDTWISDKVTRSLFMNGRYYGLLSVLALQPYTSIPSVLRGQVDYVFILRENQFSARRTIYEQFASIFPTFELFSQIMDQCTEDYECLVIHNGAKTNKIEDCVFWYKAATRPEFKIGSRKHWAKSAEYERLKAAAAAAEEMAPSLTSVTLGGTGPIVQVKKSGGAGEGSDIVEEVPPPFVGLKTLEEAYLAETGDTEYIGFREYVEKRMPAA